MKCFDSAVKWVSKSTILKSSNLVITCVGTLLTLIITDIIERIYESRKDKPDIS